jgi:hypothetical protein
MRTASRPCTRARAGEEPLGVAAGHRVERVGPLLGIALHLLRVPAVRRLPDDEIAGEEAAALGHPEPEGVVGLALRRGVLQRHVAEPLRQALAHEQRRRIEALGKHRLRQRELPLVDARVPAVHEAVAMEAAAQFSCATIGGPLAGVEERAQAERVVDVAVRVERDPERRVAPAADGLVHAVRRVREAGIDQHEPVARAERVRVHERGMHEDVGRDLGGTAEEAELGVRGIGRHHRWAMRRGSTRSARRAATREVRRCRSIRCFPTSWRRCATTNRLVLRAAPGAGKTTRVPAALLDAGIASDRHVVVVEPRRIAARAAAEFVARERGAAVGGEVGYRVRFARKGGDATRLWFLTEGVFGRDLARDPFLEAVGVVVLDEFHERHLQSDVALAVVRELQDTVRPT